ncbi:MAG: glycerophosphodiester phosphodiesterase [Gammaproteobacteria bacterium]|nr:glycerophosphodiester phosphodiesterase [Gammaproteobacteria bacterium]
MRINLKTFAVAAAVVSGLLGLPAQAQLGGDSEGHGGHPRHHAPASSYGPRPVFLVDQMDEGPLKRKLQSCLNQTPRPSNFSIGHRGAALQFPEHTKESYIAAARMGAGIIECDVTFTKDRQLVCRHSQCDLHTTTNILAIPGLAAKCSVPFQPADPINGVPVQVECCTSDLTLAEFKQLKGKMDAGNPLATSVTDYMDATPKFRTDLYASEGTLMTHAESIQLIKSLGAKFTPELKGASVVMPFEGDYRQQDYAQQMINEYKAAGINPRDVWPQSFDLNDILYWINNEPRFGRQAVYLDDLNSVSEYPSYEQLAALANQGVRYLAPPLWALLAVDGNNRIVPSRYAQDAKSLGFKLITWTLERSGPLASGGGWYYQSVTPAINNDGDMLTALDVLARQVGVKGVFSDWPATVTFYANCMGR